MAKKKFFGTDGIRGRVGQAPITPEQIVRLGWALGSVLKERNGKAGKVVIGKDTRISGYMLESAMEVGLSASGMDTILLGPMPTPGIAYLTRTYRATAGVVISASHNPYHDNGIKFFSSKGFKFDDEMEFAIEAKMEEALETVDSSQIGKAVRFEDAAGRYIEYCKSTFPQRFSLEGLTLAIDCAHGAAYHVAPYVFRELGANVIVIGDKPDGLNINEQCGSTSLDALQATVLKHNADIGIAYDGDGDRTLLIDQFGKIINGDEILYIIAMERKRRGVLEGGVVGTIMTNLGLEKVFEAEQIPFERSKVGDRYVLERMQEKGWDIGGEASGHIISLEKNTTGDGVIASLEILGAMCRQEKTLDQLLIGLTMYPQHMINVKLTDKNYDVNASTGVQAALKEAESLLGDKGRYVLRASGTEPLIRVMVEAEDKNLCHSVTKMIAEAVQRDVSAI